MALLKIEGIEKDYNQGDIAVKALKGIDLTINQGEFVAIMGASGSGKSTMMNILGCLDKPSSGAYFLEDEDVSQFDQSRLAEVRNKKIGFVFQSFNLLPKLTALENVELPMVYGGTPKPQRRQQAMLALQRVGLEERVSHRPNQLSGGQKQRVAIARALVNNPSIIMADEPTGNLDSASTVEIMHILQRLNVEGTTVVMVTHEPEVAQYTKRIVVFKDGEIKKDSLINESVVFGGEA